MRFVVPFFIVCGLAAGASSCAKSNRNQNDCTPCKQDVVQQSYVHKYGIEVPEEEWSSRGQSGKVVSTLKNGVVVTATYADGYLDGDTSYTFPHSGAIERIETYVSGRLFKEQEMFATGAPKREVQYASPIRRTVTVWYESGTPHYREEYENNRLIEADYYTKNNQIESRIDNGNGFRVVRDEFGQLISKDKFDRGELVVKAEFYPNGSPKEIIPYLNGKVNGQRKTFLPGGEPRTIEEWSNDRQEGITVVFQNGEKIAEVPYLNGIKNGVEQRYKDEAFIVEEISWKNGKKHGPCHSYIGESTRLSWYFDGQEVSKRQYDYLINPLPH